MNPKTADLDPNTVKTNSRKDTWCRIGRTSFMRHGQVRFGGMVVSLAPVVTMVGGGVSNLPDAVVPWRGERMRNAGVRIWRRTGMSRRWAEKDILKEVISDKE